MNENYGEILGLCKVMIERDYAPCGLEDDIKKRVLDLTLDWETRKGKASKEGKEIGGLRVIFIDVYRAVNQARANEKRFGKPRCYYLRRGLQIEPSRHGGLGYYFSRMTE